MAKHNIAPLPSGLAAVRAVLTLVALAWLTQACGAPADQQAGEAPKAAATAEQKSGLEVLSPSASILTEMGALYLQVVNHDDTPDRLLRVESPAADTAEIHVTSEEDGVVRMRHQPDGIPIPPGQSLELAPGGSHIMLLGATVPATDPVQATLFFEKAGAVEIAAPLATLDQMGGAGDHHGHAAADHEAETHGGQGHGEQHGEQDHGDGGHDAPSDHSGH